MHARWWSKVYGSGVNPVQIIYLAGRDNANADALSCNPQLPPPTEDIADTDIQVAVVTTSNMHDNDVSTLLGMEPGQPVLSEFAMEQRKDPALAQNIAFIENEELPAKEKRAKAVVAQASVLMLVDNLL